MTNLDNGTASDPSVSRLRSHFRTPSTSTLNSIHHNGGFSPALNSTSGPRGWDSTSHLSALSRTSSCIDVKPPNGLLKNKGKATAAAIDFPSGSSQSVQGDDHETSQNGGLTGFIFHTMKDCTKLLFQEDGDFPVNANVSPKPRSGFMRSWSGALESDAQITSLRKKGHPTVMAVNGLIAVGTENGWVAVMNFKQELKRLCGTEATGGSRSRSREDAYRF